MRKFNKVVNGVIDKSGIILEVLDARFIDDTRNMKIESDIKKKDKILIHVINKCDQVDKEYMEKVKKTLENCVFVSAREHFGTTMLKQKIITLANKKKIGSPKIGVVGYPNVGKSSIINALKGRYSAKTSSEAGYTKGEQYLKVSNNFLMIDTPGVISKENKKDLVLIGAKNPHDLKDPDLAVIKLIEAEPGFIEDKYKVKIKDPEETIEDIAKNLNMKKKGNLPDIERVSRRILQDWLKSN